MTPSNDEPLITPLPASTPAPAVNAVELDQTATAGPTDLPKVGARYIWFMVLAQFGVFMAFITPLAISLSIRVAELAPGHDEVLGYITGAGALFVMLTAPFMGVWSDRTRTRFGRRRPFMVGGMVVGVVSLVVMALAPSLFVLGLGWVLAQWGWGRCSAICRSRPPIACPSPSAARSPGSRASRPRSPRCSASS
ncbi:MAG: MFS transporter [Microbacterium sp.]|uniref:MFS transporter n=1 Tax=Microbacterium sp. TaxID=51671 RepID=UPI003F812ADC